MFFFIMGINTGRKDLDFHQMVVCSRCGRYSNYSVFMTYTVLSLFFIPVFRWNRKYYVTTGCCKTTWLLDPEVGKAIARGEKVNITPQDLSPVYTNTWHSQRYGSWQDDYRGDRDYYNDTDRESNTGNRNEEETLIDVEAIEDSSQNKSAAKTCSNCGFTTKDDDFVFCPKCGNRL